MTDTSTRNAQGATATLTTDTMLTISEIVDLTGRDRKTVSEWVARGTAIRTRSRSSLGQLLARPGQGPVCRGRPEALAGGGGAGSAGVAA